MMCGLRLGQRVLPARGDGGQQVAPLHELAERRRVRRVAEVVERLEVIVDAEHQLGAGAGAQAVLELLQPVLCLGERLLERAELRRVLVDGQLRSVARLRAAREDPVQRIVIFRRDGVELVVVAARARHGQREEALRHHINAVVNQVVRVVVQPRAERDEAQRGQVAARRLRVES